MVHTLKEKSLILKCEIRKSDHTKSHVQYEKDVNNKKWDYMIQYIERLNVLKKKLSLTNKLEENNDKLHETINNRKNAIVSTY